MRTPDEMESLLKPFPQYHKLLYRRGYLLTTANDLNLKLYPFLGCWSSICLGALEGREILVHYHNDRQVHIRHQSGVTMALIGHAYNPETMAVDEPEVLGGLLDAWDQSETRFFDEVGDLTGVHVIVVLAEDRVVVVQDCAGMMAAYFGYIGEDLFVTSHPQLVAEIRELEQDPFVVRLVRSRLYNIGNRYLPGNSSPFLELTRLGGNTYATFSEIRSTINRFFPTEELVPLTSQTKVDEALERIADILRRNLELVARKWSHPAISLTGGTDSKTTLASASGLYDHFSYFSYYSKPSELIDSDAAHAICEALGLEHLIYKIPESNEAVVNFPVLKAIIDHNTSYFVNLADHEIRKMIYLEGLEDFDLEIKSWVSEVARVFLERKYGIKMPDRLTARHLSIFQTRYFGDRSLIQESDRRYGAFLEQTGLEVPMEGYEHADLFYWEIRMGAWGASVVSAFDFCHDVTMPFNNRRLLSLMLSLPRDMRKSDAAYREIMALGEPAMVGLKAEVKNLYFRGYRIWLEKIYYFYRVVPAFLRRPRRTKPN